jgi:hypothetical protein
MSRRTVIVYLLLGAAMGGILAWQAIDHRRSVEEARSALRDRAGDITSTVGVVIRSQRRMGGIVSQSRLESALKELVKSEELKGVALFNVAGEVVASAGEPIDFRAIDLRTGERWDKQQLMRTDLVDLGAAVPDEREGAPPTIVWELPSPPSGRGRGEGLGAPSERRRFREERPLATNETGSAHSLQLAETRPRFPPPFWRHREEEFQSLVEKQGLHGFVIVMSTAAVESTRRQDLSRRALFASMALLSCLGLGLAWRNLEKSSDLRLRLVRTSQLNTHLKEMNLAAAGLAHETRNPLNIIRGLAQMISKEPGAAPEVRAKSQEIAGEVDRVTAQLNEFLHYSRPREVRRTSVGLNAVISDVVRALQSDLEDKEIDLQRHEESFTVEADEQMLRQVFFNLLINAIQAAPQGGKIRVITGQDRHGIYFEICDNGPGVPAEHRLEIFRPYFTTTQNGTGLGLAVVNQIVLAHGWEIECKENPSRGAIFRVSGLNPA